jgi:starch synthase
MISAKSKKKVLFVAGEVAPMAKVGGLADVIGALPKALKKLGVDVKIVIPKYGIIDEKKYPLKKIAGEIKIPFYNQEELVNIYSTFLPETQNQVEVYLVENLKYLSKGNVYFIADASSSGEINECQRFVFFTKCIVEIFLKNKINWQPDIFHCHDWHVGFLPLLIKMQTKGNQKTLFTIHNFAYQGKYNPQEIFKMLNLKETDWPTLKEKTKNQFEDLNAVQQAILNADLINTVSPTYAQEILTKEFGEGLENNLKKRKNNLSGIVNGIDTTFFNPMIDSNLKKNYGLKMTNKELLKNKEENKNYLQKIYNLKINSKIPIIGIISRLAEQKGFDLIIASFKELMKLNLQIVLLGAGDLKIEKKLIELSLKYPNKFSCNFKFDAKLANQIYAGSDMFLMPSHFEPCGLGQLIAMRYGTVPIVRKTGGLTDTVKNIKCQISNVKCQGIGFVFEKYEAKEMLNSIKKALEAYRDKKEWQKIIFHNMKQNFSWETSAKKYLKLYQKLLKI